MNQQIDFYLLGSVDQTGKFNYACRIAQKAFKQGLKVYMRTENKAHSQQLDSMLWTFSQNSFVPHLIVTNDHTSWEDFPVQLGESLSVNAEPDLLISLTTQPPNPHSQFKRIADLITDDPTEKQSGRIRFKYYREQGIEPNTHNIT